MAVGGLILPHFAGCRGLLLAASRSSGDQTYHGGREGLDSLSAAASGLLAVTQLSGAQLLLSSTAARATLSLAGAVVAALALGDWVMFHLGCLASPPHHVGSGGRARHARPPAPWVCGQHKMEQGGVGGGRTAALH